MQEDQNKLKLAIMSLLRLHHVPWSPEDVLPCNFDEELEEVAPDPTHREHGDRLIVEVNCPDVGFKVHDHYLIQILKSNKLWVRTKSGTHATGRRHLHEMHVIIWGCCISGKPVTQDRSKDHCTS